MDMYLFYGIVQVLGIVIAMIAVFWVMFYFFCTSFFVDGNSIGSRVFTICSLLCFILSSFSGVIALSGGYRIPYEYSYILAIISLCIYVVYHIRYRKDIKNIFSKRRCLYFLVLILAYVAAYSVKISADKQDEYHRQKGEICTVVRLYEDSKEFIGPSIPSNDMLIPGDKMYQKRLFVVLRHEKVYDVSIDSVSSKRVTVSFVSNPPSDEKLVIHYETSHLVERAVARKLEDIRYVNLIEKGDTVYLYKNHLMFK